MIEIQGLDKRYGKRVALAGVSVTFPAGKVTLLLGANGAGKSTLLRCVLGLTSFEGRVRVGGLDPLANGRGVRSAVGYMPQSGGLHPDLTVDETMALYADIRRTPRSRCGQLLDDAGLADERSTRVGDLSGGMRQRLGFALALLADPKILILDEPSSSLDAASRQWLARRLRAMAAEGRTVLVSTHAGQELLEAGDCRLVLEEGRVIEATGTDAPPAPAAPFDHARPGAIAPIVRKELRDALQNRWLIGYAIGLGVLGLAATAAGLDSTSGLSLQAFGRTTATLMNLCLLLAPLVAVLMGAASIAGEQERGTLEHLLAQPLSRTALLLGKHAGVLLSLAVATFLGFTPAAILIAAASGPSLLGHYALFPGIAVLAAAAMASVGMFISVSSRSAAQAQGAGVFVWFAFVLLYDLLLMGSLAMTTLPVEGLSALLVVNPIDASRVLGVLALEPDLYLLGPAGAFLAARLGVGATAALLITVVGVWACLPVVAAMFQFSVPLRRKRRHETNGSRAVLGRERPRSGDRVHVGRGIA